MENELDESMEDEQEQKWNLIVKNANKLSTYLVAIQALSLLKLQFLLI